MPTSVGSVVDNIAATIPAVNLAVNDGDQRQTQGLATRIRAIIRKSFLLDRTSYFKQSWLLSACLAARSVAFAWMLWWSTRACPRRRLVG